MTDLVAFPPALGSGAGDSVVVAAPSGADRAPIQAAIDSLGAGGGQALLRAGATYVIDAPIVVPSNVKIRGAGAGTIVRAAPAFAGAGMFTLAAAATEQVGLDSFTIDGNKANVVAGAPHGVYFFNSGALFPFTHTDAHNRLTNLFIYGCKGDGIQLDSAGVGNGQARETRITGCTVYDCDGRGVYPKIASDLKIVDTVCGNNGLDGFLLESSGATQLTACKAFGSGQINSTTSGYGFRIKSGQTQATGCQAQDNRNNGWQIEAIDFTGSGLLADSNGTTAVTRVGFNVALGDCELVGCTAVDRWAGGAKVQAYGFQVAAGVDNVRIIGRSRAPITGHVNNLSSGKSVELRVNQGWQPSNVVSPMGAGVNPLGGSLSAKGVPTTNGARMGRVVVPKTGTLTDLAVFVTTTGGNIDVFVLDTGDGLAGSYTRLFSTGSILTPAAAGWRIVGNPNLAVVAGQELIFGWASDTFTPIIGHHNLGATFAPATVLPAGFQPVAGGAAPKLAATAATVFPFPATLAEAAMLSTNADGIPLIIARIV